MPQNLFQIYPEYNVCHGPYTSGKDKRARVILVNTLLQIKTTRLFAKILLECSIGRKLANDETVDHEDKNPFNDSPSNLRILSRAINASIAAKENKYSLGYKQTNEQKRSGAKNGKARLTNEDVKDMRNLFSEGKINKEEIANITSLCRRAIENILSGRSYTDAEGTLSIFKVGRKAGVAKLVETHET